MYHHAHFHLSHFCLVIFVICLQLVVPNVSSKASVNMLYDGSEVTKELQSIPPLFHLESSEVHKTDKIENCRASERSQNLSTLNIQCVARAVYFEARNQSLKGKLAIIDVIVTRAKQANTHNLCSIVRERGQFSYIGKNYKIHNKKIFNEIKSIVLSAFNGDISYNVVPGATHYHSKTCRPSWARKMKYVATIGSHIFYKE